MEAIDKIREAGLKLTPQRKAVYEAMMELRHAPIEAIISCVQSKDKEITLSTVYRILDSFYKARKYTIPKRTNAIMISRFIVTTICSMGNKS